ncbi:uncharacterized protein BDZ99DRAFT_461270 [Mytilinidion resinicola]|uniref:Uncharacterized protein n=1 Tax=Mytilinidion resinicola TaxID=574789 RepID=A0A6A6YV03_9PEZI|nr:uncharacterized protein BDZ99DRAFT_461270 [Mytilinidion resinicola]KAF2812611.1 hypothetical protein BDZ99DRAFT_461270 [Mytilinidion resinicola]
MKSVSAHIPCLSSILHGHQNTPQPSLSDHKPEAYPLANPPCIHKPHYPTTLPTT